MIGKTDGEKRREVINGLIEAAEYLKHHVDIPVPDYIEIHYCVQAHDDAAKHAGVDRIARMAGETPGGEYGHYGVRHDFSPAVSYRAVAIDSAEMSAWRDLVVNFEAPHVEAKAAA